MSELLITRGKVITADSAIDTDVAIKDGKIYSIGNRGLALSAGEAIRADGKIIVAGGIDPHVHIATGFVRRKKPR